MGAILDALLRLQEIETQLGELRQQIAARQQAVRAQEKRIAALTAELDAKRKAARDRQIEADRANLEVKSYEERIAKLRAALNTAKTNKEYSTLLSELNTLKADSGKLEEKTLLIMTEIDGTKRALAVEDARLADEHTRLGEARKAADDFQQRVADRLARLTAEREKAADPVPPTVLGMFERVAAKNAGEGMAVVIRTNPRREEFVCGGCNMGVTLQQVNAIISRDEPILCNTCGRILHLEQSIAGGAR